MPDLIAPRIIGPEDKAPAECFRFITGYPARAYHADREAISQGCLSTLAYQSPAHFAHEWAQPYQENTDGSPAMRLGTICHHALLEPDVYAKYLAQPQLGDGRTKAGKAARADWLAQMPSEWVDTTTDEEGKETRTVNGKALILQPWEKIAADAMAANVRNHPRVRALGLFDGQPLTEQTVYWVDKPTGVLQRARLDLVKPERRLVVDLKTTDSAHARDFARRIADNRYHFQAAHYVDAASAAAPGEPFDYLFIVIEREAPYAVALYLLTSKAIAAAEAVRCYALDTLRNCIASRVWPGYSDRVETIDLPPYAYSQQPGVEVVF
jgi:hypothetical protein